MVVSPLASANAIFGNRAVNRRSHSAKSIRQAATSAGVARLSSMSICCQQSFLAYVLWKLLGQLCQQAGLGNEPRRVLDELSELRVVDVVQPTKDGREIRSRCVTQPSGHQRILLERLGLELPGHLHLKEM